MRLARSGGCKHPGCRAPSALDPDRLPPRCALRTMRADLLPREANVSSCVRGPSRPLCVLTNSFEILPGQRESQGFRHCKYFPVQKQKRECAFFSEKAHCTYTQKAD